MIIVKRSGNRRPVECTSEFPVERCLHHDNPVYLPCPQLHTSLNPRGRCGVDAFQIHLLLRYCPDLRASQAPPGSSHLLSSFFCVALPVALRVQRRELLPSGQQPDANSTGLLCIFRPPAQRLATWGLHHIAGDRHKLQGNRVYRTPACASNVMQSYEA